MTQDQTKHKQQKQKKLMLIRYGRMGLLGWFEHKENHIPKTANRVVIKTERGLEMGELVGQFHYRGGHFKSSPEQVQEYYGKTQKDQPLTAGGTFVRFATAEDVMEEKHLDASAKEEKQCCERFVKEMELPMKIVDAEHVFGGERIIIYFISSGRVDFRELVKRLAREYQTRIELRQIGARDEARIVSDYESCGQACCCRQFLKILEPVNMRMAKLQKATLDPSKISGHCGRLKCCLRYEDATYRDLRKKLPKKNTMVRTSEGVGKVVDMQILTQLVVVQDETGKRKAFRVDEIEVINDQNQDTAPAVQDNDEKQEERTGRGKDAGAAETAGRGEKREDKTYEAPKANHKRTQAENLSPQKNRKDTGRGSDKD